MYCEQSTIVLTGKKWLRDEWVITEYCPLIGRDSSRDLNTDLWLAETGPYFLFQISHKEEVNQDNIEKRKLLPETDLNLHHHGG